MKDRSASDLGILNKCGAPGSHIYQWPGIFATYICQQHLEETIKVAEMLGLEMQYAPLKTDKQCERTQVGLIPTEDVNLK